MPRLRENVTPPRPRKLGEAMTAGQSRAVTVVGVLLATTITIAGAAFVLRIAYPGRSTNIWVVLFAVTSALLFIGVLVRAMLIGTEDKSKPD